MYSSTDRSDGRRQLDKRLKTIKQRPKVHITRPEGERTGGGRRVLLPVRVWDGPWPILVVVVAIVVVGAGLWQTNYAGF